jgi:hypothetical protein
VEGAGKEVEEVMEKRMEKWFCSRQFSPLDHSRWRVERSGRTTNSENSYHSSGDFHRWIDHQAGGYSDFPIGSKANISHCARLPSN